MNASAAVRDIASAVLYEGYMLWPYRHTAMKNRRRWTFGCVFPRSWRERGHDDDRDTMRAECLVEAANEAWLDVTVRFLHIVQRRAARLEHGAPQHIDALEADGSQGAACDVAAEREVAVSVPIGAARPASAPIEVAAASDHDWLSETSGADDKFVAAPAADGATLIVRSWHALSGSVEASTEPLRDGLHRVRVDITNVSECAAADREDALRSAFASTHLVLRARGGAFVSTTSPPPELEPFAAACRNEGCWPVLVGEPGSRDTMLAAPIILPDYPGVAPESPGDLFDGGEIDELLVLNILALTEQEKAAMHAADPRTREILERTERLTNEQMLRLHGTFRDIEQTAPRDA